MIVAVLSTNLLLTPRGLAAGGNAGAKFS